MTRRALAGFIFINIFVSIVVVIGIILIWDTTTEEDPTVVTRVFPVTVAGQGDSSSPGGVPTGAFQLTIVALNDVTTQQARRNDTLEAVLRDNGLEQATSTTRPASNSGADSSGLPTLPPEVLNAVTLPPGVSSSNNNTGSDTDGGDTDAEVVPEDGCRRYTVVSGDTCLLIAERFDTNLQDLIGINNGINTNCTNLRIDQEILIPGDTCQPPPTSTPTIAPPTPSNTPFSVGTFSITNTPVPTATDAEVSISQVLNFGEVNSEQVDIRNTSGGVIALADWTLEDDDGNSFIFPDTRLQPGQIIRIFTRVGQNTPGALYWNETVAVWEEGDIATLTDASGTVQSTYEVGTEEIDFGDSE